MSLAPMANSRVRAKRGKIRVKENIAVYRDMDPAMRVPSSRAVLVAAMAPAVRLRLGGNFMLTRADSVPESP